MSNYALHNSPAPCSTATPCLHYKRSQCNSPSKPQRNWPMSLKKSRGELAPLADRPKGTGLYSMLAGAAAAARAASSATHKATMRQCPSCIWPLSPRGHPPPPAVPRARLPCPRGQRRMPSLPVWFRLPSKEDIPCGVAAALFPAWQCCIRRPQVLQRQRERQRRGIKVGCITL